MSALVLLLKLSLKRNCFCVLHTTYQEESLKFEQCLIKSLLQSFLPCMAADTVTVTPCIVDLSHPVRHHSTITF